MRPFAFSAAPDAAAAVQAAGQALRAAGGAPAPDGLTSQPVQYLAGGTTLLDLMKLDVMRPGALIDVNALSRRHAEIEAGSGALRLGAFARMSDVADHPAVRRDYPVIAESLALAASAQLRNMATLGGNVLQRTRCPYFRDTSWACNKREPGTGCSALEGHARLHAVLGVSDSCIASYPGDWAQALIALDVTVDILGPAGARQIPFERLHTAPGATPHIETTLQPGELITGFTVARGPYLRRSTYVKVRDRASYAFGLATAAVALDLDGEVVREARIGLGGVSARPWRAREAEQALAGQRLDEASAMRAAEAAFAWAKTSGAKGHDNGFKPELGRRTLVRALLSAKAMPTAGREV